MDIGDFRIGEESIDDRLSIAVLNKFGIYLSVVSCVRPQQQRKFAEFIRVTTEDFRVGLAIVFMYINRACFRKHSFFLKRPVLKQQPSLAGIEATQATPANASPGLGLLDFWLIAELIVHLVFQVV